MKPEESEAHQTRERLRREAERGGYHLTPEDPTPGGSAPVGRRLELRSAICPTPYGAAGRAATYAPAMRRPKSVRSARLKGKGSSAS
jgi:hypothetical protein